LPTRIMNDKGRYHSLAGLNINQIAKLQNLKLKTAARNATRTNISKRNGMSINEYQSLSANAMGLCGVIGV